jgi:hypothetical protein
MATRRRRGLVDRLIDFVPRVIRHPVFPVLYTIGTAYWWWAHPPQNGWASAFRDDAYPWPMWTSLASLMALWIESAIGLWTWRQTAKDAEAARALAAQNAAVLALLERAAPILDAIPRLEGLVRAMHAEMVLARHARNAPDDEEDA